MEMRDVWCGTETKKRKREFLESLNDDQINLTKKELDR